MFQSIGQFIVSASLALAGLFGYHQALLGSAVYVPAPRYESSLAQSMSATQTSTMYLVSGVDGNGETLTGNMCFTLDSGVANTVEDVCGVASGTQVTALIRGVDTSGFTASSTLAHVHRVGADVKITDSPYLAQYSAFLNGSQGLPNPLIYNASNTPTVVGANILNLASVGYVNSTTYSSAPNGSASVKGIYQEATGAQIASGTTSGSTGADLALTTNITATSSKANSVVTTNASGTLDPSFVSPSSTYSVGGLISASTTLNGTTNINGTTTFQNAPLGITNIWGIGTTTAIISASTTLTSDVYYGNLTIATSVVLETANYKIFISGTLTVNGTIDNSGGNGGSASLTTPGTAASAIATGTLPSNIGGHIGGPANGVAGYYSSGGSGSGQGGAGGGSGASGGIVDIFARTIVIGTSGVISSNGGSGGNGGVGAVGTSGSGSGSCISGGSAPSNSTSSNVLNSIGVNSNSTSTNGGSGGSGCGAQSGATIVLGTFATSTFIPNNVFTAFSDYNFVSPSLNNTSAQAPGGSGGGVGGSVITGSGGSGGGGGGGFGGNGGVVILIYSNITNNGTITTNGGLGGAFGTAGATGGGIGTSGLAGLTGSTGIIYQIQI